METILFLIRHGETEWNLARRIQGHSDIQLNELGNEQAKRLAAWYQNHHIDAIYSSDLSRAHHTALPLASLKGLEVQRLSALRERCYGDWEGLTYEEIRERFRDVDPEQSIYGIEPFVKMQQRADTVLTDIAARHLGQTVAVVSHGGFINSFLHWITEGKQGTGISRIDNTGVSLLRFAHERWEVLKVNDTAHLQS